MIARASRPGGVLHGTIKAKYKEETKMLVREMPIGEKPQERIAELGGTYLSNSELLAVLLGADSKDVSAMDMAGEILNRCGDAHLEGLADLSLAELMSIKGIGRDKATKILAAVELSRRLSRTAGKAKTIISCPDDAAEYAMSRLMNEQREHFAVILVNVKNHIISMPIISIGSLTASVVHPREVFKAAIKHTAAAMILVHNHPSGDPEPSREDIATTKRLVEVGKLMDIPVLDHIIIGRNRYASLKEKGVIK